MRNTTGAIASVLRLTDGLGHGSHGTVYTPGAWFIQNHGNQSQNGGCEHHAVKTKGKLCYPLCNSSAVVCPIPRQFNCPKECHHFFQVSCTFEHQIGAEKHVKEHDEKEDQKSITEPLAPQEFGNIIFPGKSQFVAQQVKELASATEFIAIHFISAKNGNQQRNKEAQQPHPCKKDIEKAQNQIGSGNDS